MNSMSNEPPLLEDKIMVRFRAVGTAKPLRIQTARVKRSETFGGIVKFIERQTKESAFCYINQAFSPSLDSCLGNLYDLYQSDDTLEVSYSIAQAFG